jgi:hypothetical protein
VKRFFAILSSLLLVWAQFAPAGAVPMVCGKPVVSADACSQMACCMAKPVSDPQPAPAVPAQTASQNQISLLAPAMVVWLLPNRPANPFASASVSPLAATGIPLYTRNCTLLI